MSAKQGRCLLFPSIEAAVTEIGLLLADRERELGGTRSILFYGSEQDPALEAVAKVLSSVGLDAKPLDETEMLTSDAWLKAEASSTLFLAVAESDRFDGKVRNLTGLRAARTASAAKVPLLILSAQSLVSGYVKPEPQEIRIHEIFLKNGSSVAVAFIGDRLRLEPRLAPLSFSSVDLEMTLEFIESLPATTDASALEATLKKNRADIEAFESALSKSYQAYWPKGSDRLVDRAILTSTAHDGSWTIDRLVKMLAQQGVDELTARRGLFSLSGCATNDERRQEWLRARGGEELRLRGMVHISLDLIRAVPLANWQEALKI